MAVEDINWWYVGVAASLALLVAFWAWWRWRQAGSKSPSRATAETDPVPMPIPQEHARGPFVEIGLVINAPDIELEEVAPDQRIASTLLRSLVEQSPALAVAGTQLYGQSFQLVFSPELQRGLAEGTLRILPSAEVSGGVRSLVVDKSTGLLRGHGTLVRNPAVIVAGVFQSSPS